MSDLTAQRTLVKSPPELWSELSDLENLAHHLGEFGEIQITKLEPEHTIAWEGEHVSGIVAIEASGWGTRVTMTVAISDAEAPAAAAIEAEREPAPVEAPAPEPELEPTTAELAAIEFTATKPVAPPAPEPSARPPAPPPAERVGFFGRLFGRRRAATAPVQPQAAPEPALPAQAPPEPEPEPAPAPVAPEPQAHAPEAPEEAAGHAPMGEQKVREVLHGALEDLGAAHHRPFSRG